MIINATEPHQFKVGYERACVYRIVSHPDLVRMNLCYDDQRPVHLSSVMPFCISYPPYWQYTIFFDLHSGRNCFQLK
jgi:hypothetical protein